MSQKQDAAILDLSAADAGDSLDNVASQLQFQDFAHDFSQSSTATKPFQPTITPDDSANTGDDEDETLINKKQVNVAPFWELAYFANYFDVTTRDVVSRVLWSVLPIAPKSVVGSSKSNYIERHIQHNPDLYGS